MKHRKRSPWVGLALLAIFLLALALRGLGFEWVFVDAETVVFPPSDAQYHVRRSLYAWLNFPRVLLSDPYINFPGGAAISWPPLFDFVVGLAARLLARDTHGFQVVAAWIPPLFGSLITLPVYLLGRELGSRSVGLGAAALIALFPMSVSYSRVGQLDHHCAVTFIGAWLLLFVVRLVAGTGSPLRLGIGLALARTAMLLTWHGSLLYLGVVEVILWVSAALQRKRSLYAVQAASALGVLCVVGPVVWLFPEPLAGEYSAIALSRLHVLAVTAVTFVSGALWWLEGRGGHTWGDSAVRRLAWTGGLGAVFVAILFALPGPREGLEPALRFLTMTDGVGRQTGEQLPLFPIFGRPVGRPAWEVWGFFAYAIPLAPFAVVLGAERERRAAAWALAAWCGVFGALAIVQRRYGNDLGPAAAVAFAIALAAVGRRAAPALRSPLPPLVAVGIGVAMLSIPLWGQYRPWARSSVKALRGDFDGHDRAMVTVAGTLTRFMERVRRASAETSGYLDFSESPEYGIVANANLGHALQNVAHRPTPTDPFWAFIGRENWRRSTALLNADSEARALELAEELRARYVVTMLHADPSTLEGWLHHGDGLDFGGRPASPRFRLVTEAAPGGAPLGDLFRRRDGRSQTDRHRVPYKLFEIVDGAVIRVIADPSAEVELALELESPSGRVLHYRTSAIADAEGVARLRVPHATDEAGDGIRVVARGRYRIRVGDCQAAVAVTDAQVRSGEVIDVGAGLEACIGPASATLWSRPGAVLAQRKRISKSPS